MNTDYTGDPTDVPDRLGGLPATDIVGIVSGEVSVSVVQN